jgi:hypothetical protein
MAVFQPAASVIIGALDPASGGAGILVISNHALSA